MNAGWLQPRWLFNRRVARTLLWTLLLVALAMAANIAGLYLVGSIVGWERWLADAAGYFLLWRLCLYWTTAYGWVWLRRRLLTRESDASARHRLLRTEIAGVIAIVALEASLLMQAV
ncbi:hypothetical protein [Pseudomonas sp. Ant30-3]|uniref:hypothetical protein n=1 Tax=Pseudomonas sp. Ant30-3 TaxID=1488328 RepID=UPI00048EED2A|nr:hypothetical protein [Pseudomonas sp. Ant30-3]